MHFIILLGVARAHFPFTFLIEWILNGQMALREQMWQEDFKGFFQDFWGNFK